MKSAAKGGTGRRFMGYNIGDVGGEATGGVDVWEATLDLSDPFATTISGDFNEIPLFGGGGGEASGGYTFSALSNPAWGTLVTNSVTGEYTFIVNRSAVINSGNSQVVSFTVTGSDGSSTDTDTVTITILICVARGTLIQTEAGPVPVERLTIGDRVTTLDGPPQPVRWIGSRRLSRTELEVDPSLRPIRIAQAALGEGAPARDLLVSPQHRVLLNGWRAELFFGEPQVLVPAKSLVNDSTITVMHDVEGVEYFHLLFDCHEIILTENLPTESFFPGAHSMAELDGAARAELLRLFPALAEDAGYGEPARPSLRPWEARVLTAPVAEA